MLFKGFKFGMLLQIAVGPICLFIFQVASSVGFSAALTGVLAVTLVDGAFILAAIFGIGRLIERSEGVKKGLLIFGSIVLIVFGLSTVLGVFDISLLPNVHLFAAGQAEAVFPRTMLLTLSNPLTIVFWAGVFSTKLAEDGMSRQGMSVFGVGAVLATLSFLTLIALLGSLTQRFLPEVVMQGLNMAVGVLLVFFGLRPLLKKGE